MMIILSILWKEIKFTSGKYSKLFIDKIAFNKISHIRKDDRKGDSMWFLCQEPYKTLDDARKRAMEIGRKNFDSIHKECYGLFFKKTVYVVLWWKRIEKGCDEVDGEINT